MNPVSFLLVYQFIVTQNAESYGQLETNYEIFGKLIETESIKTGESS